MVEKMPKKNPKHNTRIIRLKRGTFSKRNNKNLNQHIGQSIDNFDEPDPEKVSIILQDLMTTNRRMVDSDNIIEIYYQLIGEIQPERKSEQKRYILNRSQFQDFLTRLKSRIIDRMKLLITKDNITYILDTIFTGFHKLSLSFKNPDIFYILLTILLSAYPFYNSKFDEMNPKKPIWLDKFWFKDCISFQDMGIYLEYITLIFANIEFIESVELPEEIPRLSNEKSFKKPEELIHYLFDKTMKYQPSYEKDFQIYLQRMDNNGVPSWSTASFIFRMYSNMVFSALDKDGSNLIHIPGNNLFLYLNSIDNLIKQDFGLSALELSSIINGFFEFFFQIHQNMANEVKKVFASFVITNHE